MSGLAIRVLGALLLPLTLFAGVAFADETTAAPFAVVAYLPEYRLQGIDARSVEGLTDLVFFSIEPRESGELDTSRAPVESLARLKGICDKHRVRLSIALGGWERSNAFPKLSLDPEARKVFARRLTEFCLTHELAGADFDWEHPHNAAEEQGYADLLVETKRAFAPHKLVVTAAMAGWQNLPARGFEALDRIHLMAYDHDGPRHSTLANSQADVEQMLAKKGVRPAQICLGVPFYARSMKYRNRSVPYDQIVRDHKPARNADEAGDWYFNGPGTIAAKTRYALEERLGGMMIWELGQDSRGEQSLLRVIGAAAK